MFKVMNFFSSSSISRKTAVCVFYFTCWLFRCHNLPFFHLLRLFHPCFFHSSPKHHLHPPRKEYLKLDLQGLHFLNQSLLLQFHLPNPFSPSSAIAAIANSSSILIRQESRTAQPYPQAPRHSYHANSAAENAPARQTSKNSQSRSPSSSQSSSNTNSCRCYCKTHFHLSPSPPPAPRTAPSRPGPNPCQAH